MLSKKVYIKRHLIHGNLYLFGVLVQYFTASWAVFIKSITTAPILSDLSWQKYRCTSNLQDGWESIMKNSVFDNICNLQHFGKYFTVLSKVIVWKTWFGLILHQNYPCASNFDGKDEFILLKNSFHICPFLSIL